MKHSFIKHALIAGATIFTVAGVAVFAQTNIQTNIFNAWQTIMRTTYTTNGSSNGSRLLDINDGTGIYISGTLLQNTPAINGLGIDANGYVTTNVALGGGQPGPAGPQGATGYSVVTGNDADWYSVTSPGNAPLNINEDIYTYGQVGIGMQNPTVPLQVSGNVIFGNTNNFISNMNNFSSILGGQGNIIQGWLSTIGGGRGNSIQNEGFIGGGVENIIQARYRNNIVGGEANVISGTQSFANIVGGFQNVIETTQPNGSFGSSIVGGQNNSISADRIHLSFIGGGSQNTIADNASASTIAGGLYNRIHARASNILGGERNTIEINAIQSSIVGGIDNTLSGDAGISFIGGGARNTALARGSVIAGGEGNYTSNFGNQGLNYATEYPTIGGGWENRILGKMSTIGGGMLNRVYGEFSTVPGGAGNVVHANNSFAAGRTARAVHDNTFVRSDGSIGGEPLCNHTETMFACTIDIDGSMGLCPIQCIGNAGGFGSTDTNQFLVHASNGVGINTNTPTAALHVSGDARIDLIPSVPYAGTVLVPGPNGEVRQALLAGGGGLTPDNCPNGDNSPSFYDGICDLPVWEVGSGLHSAQIIGDNTNQASGDYSIVAGTNNTVIGNIGSIIGGADNIINGFGGLSFGVNHMINGDYGITLGGNGNQITGNQSAIITAEGNNNINGNSSYIIAGNSNTVTGDMNIMQSRQSAISGSMNRLSAYSSQIIGNNNIGMGVFVNILGNNIGVINMDINGPILSASQDNSFIINAPSGVGINHTTPQKALHVSGAIVSSQLHLNLTTSAVISIDAAAINSVIISADPGETITITSIPNGVAGQVLYIAKDSVNNQFNLEIPQSGDIAGPGGVNIIGPGWGGVTLLFDGNKRTIMSVNQYS